MEEHLSLTELNQIIKEAIELNFVDGCWIVAEIASLRTAGAGHCYMELVEKQGDLVKAKIRANCWNYTYRTVADKFFKITGQPLQAGMKVLFFCEVSYHEIYGVSVVVKAVDPSYTLGDMARRKKEIIARLKSEGLLQLNKKFELPIVIQKMAIISSETAAGYEDFMNQMENNDFGVQFYYHLFPAVMQGDQTVRTIQSALLSIENHKEDFDAVIIIRGGGSSIDLNSFDSYELAKSIAEFSYPVITGIGHERDDTIIDEVANTKLKTPTAVADFIIDIAGEFIHGLEQLKSNLLNGLDHLIKQEKNSIDRLINSVQMNGNKMVADQKVYLENEKAKMPLLIDKLIREKQLALSESFSTTVQLVQNQLNEEHKKLVKSSFQIKYKVQAILKEKKADLNNKDQYVYLNNPKRLLEKGYSLTYLDGKIIKSKDQLNKNDQVQVFFKDGSVQAKIEK